MKLSQRIKTELRSRYDMDLVGIAAASALQNEPIGHRPEDLLPGAKSILVFGQRMTDGALQTMFRTHEDHRVAAESSYAAFCDDLAPNFLLVNSAFQLCCWLEDCFGALALPCPFNVQQSMIWDKAPGKLFADPFGQGMPLNIWKAAMAAGLGEYGWSNRFLTPEYGPRQNLCAVLTTLELEPDAPYSGPTLCEPEKCGVCSAVCPTHAIPAPGSGCEKTVAVEGKSQTVSDINPNACAVAALGMRKGFGGRVPVPDLIMNDAPTDAELEAAFAKKPINGLSIEHFPRYFCEKCLIYCPVGRWKERFADTGLSSFDPERVKKA